MDLYQTDKDIGSSNQNWLYYRNQTKHQLNLTQVEVRRLDIIINHNLPTPPTSQTTQASYLGD